MQKMKRMQSGTPDVVSDSEDSTPTNKQTVTEVAERRKSILLQRRLKG